MSKVNNKKYILKGGYVEKKESVNKLVFGSCKSSRDLKNISKVGVIPYSFYPINDKYNKGNEKEDIKNLKENLFFLLMKENNEYIDLYETTNEEDNDTMDTAIRALLKNLTSYNILNMFGNKIDLQNDKSHIKRILSKESSVCAISNDPNNKDKKIVLYAVNFLKNEQIIKTINNVRLGDKTKKNPLKWINILEIIQMDNKKKNNKVNNLDKKFMIKFTLDELAPKIEEPKANIFNS